MAEIFVQSSAAIEQFISELQAKLNEFNGYADNIRTEHKTLVTKWEGDASDAFEENFTKEEPNLTNTTQAVEEYINAMKTILGKYETTEETNKNIGLN